MYEVASRQSWMACRRPSRVHIITSLPTHITTNSVRRSGMQLMMELCRDQPAPTDHFFPACDIGSREASEAGSNRFHACYGAVYSPAEEGSVVTGANHSRHLDLQGRPCICAVARVLLVGSG